MSRGGRRRERSEPERRCIATGEVRPAREMLRFVVSPAGELVPDVAGKLPGRGIWVSARREALERALARGLFHRAARMRVALPADLAERVEAALARRLIDTLALARKAGAAVAGHDKTLGWLESGRAAVLVQAADGSPRERERLARRARHIPRIGLLNAAEIGLAFGRERVIHAALAAGGLAERAVEEAARLGGFRVSQDRGEDHPAGSPRDRRQTDVEET
ncbi:MAG: RNA-binding protein [Alphaproteobacteria bacterium]|nr:MAG: RNA-binding protein [Alphaproteobacteria bacterium]